MLVAAQLLAVRGAVNAGQSTAGKRYSCCCVGECHCTGDCCNHPPDGSRTESGPDLRAAAGWPAVASPRSCGLWYGVLNAPSPGVNLDRPASFGLTRPAASPARLSPSIHWVTASTRGILRQSAPRAPPGDLPTTPI
jgi:hypothetical protein